MQPPRHVLHQSIRIIHSAILRLIQGLERTLRLRITAEQENTAGRNPVLQNPAVTQNRVHTVQPQAVRVIQGNQALLTRGDLLRFQKAAAPADVRIVLRHTQLHREVLRKAILHREAAVQAPTPEAGLIPVAAEEVEVTAAEAVATEVAADAN